MAKLDGYKEEILRLHEDDGMSQADILRHFAGKGITLPKSSLSDFLRQRQDEDVAVATMEDDGLAERFAAAMHFQQAVADELTDRFVEMAGAFHRLNRDAEERHTAIMEAVARLEAMPAPATDDAKLDAAIERLDALSERTGVAALKWVWLKALSITGVIWGVLVSAVHYIPGFLSILYLTILAD